jgi:nucleoside-diphosphate-sugar epimerase
VGRVLCQELFAAGYTVRAALRTPGAPAGAAEAVVIGEIHAATDWRAALTGVEIIVHLAARVHQPRDAAGAGDLYGQTNARGTERLAQMAGQSGVRRFIYLSSVKVNGESTGAHPFRAGDAPAPQDAYGESKLQGERSVQDAAAAAGFLPVIVRAPLVYGSGVRANFLSLMSWVDRERPLPFGLIDNRRSLISVWNLCDLAQRVLVHPDAAGVWLARDGEDLSTPELISKLARALQRRARLLPVPAGMLQVLGRLSGRSAEVRRLCGSLVVDDSPARQRLQWSAPLSVEEGLARTVAWYRARGSR